MINPKTVHGLYLITQNVLEKDDQPEIFLLFAKDDLIRALCVNRLMFLPKLQSVRMSSEFSTVFNARNKAFFAKRLWAPILRGGDIDKSTPMVLHTGYTGGEASFEIVKNIYYLSPLNQFVSSIEENKIPDMSHIVVGQHVFHPDEINEKTLAGSWQLRRLCCKKL